VKQKFKKQERTKYKTHTGLYTCKQAKAQNILRPTVSPEVNARIPSRVWEIGKMPVELFSSAALCIVTFPVSQYGNKC